MSPNSLTQTLWAILPDRLGELATRLPSRLAPETAAARNRPQMSGTIAVIPMFGVLAQHSDFWADVSMELWGAAFDSLVADASVKAIVMNVESPGGGVAGADKLAQKIFDARDKKRIVAVANSMMASGAYYLSSQAHEIVADPGALVGHIGVIWQHVDWSKAIEAAGVKVTTITAGKYKSEGHPTEPMTDESRAAMQAIVDGYYSQFVNAVARGRGVKVSAVRSGFGQARIMNSVDAKEVGLIDRIDTLEGTLARLSGRYGAGVSAEFHSPGIDSRNRAWNWAEVA